MCDKEALSEVRRYMRSEEGKAMLESIRESLEGRTIRKITFKATESGVSTIMHLDNKETFAFTDEDLMLDTLYDQIMRFFI
ncbi:MAG: hypothetical protein KJ052_20285 [Candidatus Hydrogenedentes bacterium]|nr:hypothetical protein [Candidatus Hydrogenedentota bacterium]